jgi:hypothetical protein
VIGPSQRPLPHNIQHSQETDIHAPSEIRTRNPRQGAAADRHLRPRGHWDRHIYLHSHIIDLIKNNTLQILNRSNYNTDFSFVFSPATFKRVSLEHTTHHFTGCLGRRLAWSPTLKQEHRLSRKCIVSLSFSQSRIYVHVLNCLALISEVLKEA